MTVSLAPPQDTPTGSASSPRQEYSRRFDDCTAAAASVDRLHDRLALVRFLLAGAVAVLLYLGAVRHTPTYFAVSAVFAVAFLGLTLYHGRILDALHRHQRLTAWYRAGLRRLDGEWAGTGVSGARFADTSHPCSGDLDIFGKGSLFELLCTARTRSGEDALARLLTQPADPLTVSARQEAVEALRDRLALREEITLLGEDVRSAMDPDRLAEWGAQPPVFTNSTDRLLAIVATGLVVIGALVWLIFKMSWPFWVAVVTGRAFAYHIGSRVSQVVRSLQRTGGEFSLLTKLLARIEREPGGAAMLADISERLGSEGKPASAHLKGLAELIGILDAMKNQLFMPIGLLLLWEVHSSFAIESWRTRYGGQVAGWLKAAGEYEALLSVSAYAWEHPDRPFPEVSHSAPPFEAECLIHPLLKPGVAVANDVAITAEPTILIVSGSNMSGKSTLLRTVGINAVLAMAGAPVCAGRLSMQSRTIGASIRTQDSLEGGISRFYAEILRLRQIVGLATDGPTLFLIDEILHGTNSQDRRVGGEAVLRALAARGAAGLATTHDLALARIAEDPALHAANVHFEDQIEGGKMSFDYHLRPGVVTRSNALELMRAVGLEV